MALVDAIEKGPLGIGIRVGNTDDSDEPGFNGLTRNQQVQLLSGPLLHVYRLVRDQYVDIRELQGADLPKRNGNRIIIPDGEIHSEAKAAWGDTVRSWYTRTDDYMNGYGERGYYLRFGDADLLWVPEKPTAGYYEVPLYIKPSGSLKIPRVPSSLVRAAEFAFDADNVYLQSEPPVRIWEIEMATAQGDWQMHRYLSRILIIQGRTSGISMADLFKHPF